MTTTPPAAEFAESSRSASRRDPEAPAARQTQTAEVPVSATDPLLRYLSDRAGGPAGRRLRPRRGAGGFWSIPRVLVALTVVGILLSALSGQYCRINGWGGVGVYHWGCYSDVAALWGSRDLNVSPWAPFSADLASFEYPAATMAVASFFAALTHWLAETTGGYWGERGGLLYWDLTFLVAAVLWIALVLITYASAGRRPWDAAIVALSPAMIFAIGINWDIWPAVALALAVLLYQHKHWLWAGVLIGIGVAFKLYPLFMLGAVLVLALRTALRKQERNHDVDLVVFAKVAAGTLISWLVINVPVMLINFEAWARFFVFSSERGAGYSSLWHVWMVLGEGPTPETVSALSFGLFAASCAGVLVLGLTVSERPRMVQLLFLIVAAFLFFSKVYSPQFMLWLVPLIALAAPRLRDVVIWNAAQVLHFWAVWMYLADVVGDHLPQHAFDAKLYVAAVILHMASTVYLMAQVIWDMARPQRDIIRAQQDLAAAA